MTRNGKFLGLSLAVTAGISLVMADAMVAELKAYDIGEKAVRAALIDGTAKEKQIFPLAEGKAVFFLDSMRTIPQIAQIGPEEELQKDGANNVTAKTALTCADIDFWSPGPDMKPSHYLISIKKLCIPAKP